MLAGNLVDQVTHLMLVARVGLHISAFTGISGPTCVNHQSKIVQGSSNQTIPNNFNC